jgi:hypothetical protein
MYLFFCLIGFDFVVLNDVMNYYIIGFNDFNPCNEFFKGGTVPMDNVLNHTHSLVKIPSTQIPNFT